MKNKIPYPQFKQLLIKDEAAYKYVDESEIIKLYAEGHPLSLDEIGFVDRSNSGIRSKGDLGGLLYYVRLEEKVSGPFTQNQIDLMWRDGRITANAEYRLSDMEDWFPASDLDDNSFSGRRRNVGIETEVRSSHGVASFSQNKLVISAIAGVLIFVSLLVIVLKANKKIVGYETDTVFISEYSSGYKLDSLTKAGWEIKSSRRAWEQGDYDAFNGGYKRKWGTEYILQKPIYR